MEHSNGCSKLAPRSSEAKQWFEDLTQMTKKKKRFVKLHLSSTCLVFDVTIFQIITYIIFAIRKMLHTEYHNKQKVCPEFERHN